MEAALIEQAFETDLPLLAICRGLQLVNRGARRHADPAPREHRNAPSEERRGGASDRGDPVGTRLAAIMGTDSQMVNSRHHQAVGAGGPGLRVSATAPDGVVEALEDPLKRFAIAVPMASRRTNRYRRARPGAVRSFAAALG